VNLGGVAPKAASAYLLAMPVRRRVLLAGLLLPFVAAASPTPLAQLRAGGLTLYIRHSLTERLNQPDNDLSTCDGQRNLTEAGRAAAREIGAAITELGVPVGEVLSSPFSRCRDTATLAFGRATVVSWLVTNAQFETGAERGRIAQLWRTLQTPPAEGNRVLAAHGFNLEGLHRIHGWAPQRIAEAECVIYRPAEMPEVLARVTHDRWRALAA
jgi:hypothetical protein